MHCKYVGGIGERLLRKASGETLTGLHPVQAEDKMRDEALEIRLRSGSTTGSSECGKPSEEG